MAALPNCLSPHPEGPFTLFNPYLTHTVLGLKLFTALILSGPGEAAGAQVLGQPGLPRAASFPSAFSGPESGFLHKQSGWARGVHRLRHLLRSCSGGRGPPSHFSSWL